MEVFVTQIPDVISFTPDRFQDHRGYFSEVFSKKKFCENVGHDIDFLQDNESLSTQEGTIRGLHFQKYPYWQGKLVRVLSGSLLDVCVDIRQSSKSFGQHVSIELSSENGKQLWIPPGFAHGFCTLEPNTKLTYKVSNNYYEPNSERSLAWNDPDLAINWPELSDPSTLSEKDFNALTLNDAVLAGELYS